MTREPNGKTLGGEAAWSPSAHRARALPEPHIAPVAPYACDPLRSGGRVHGGAPSPTRSEFQRDRDRILHSTAFRRLRHKTQVFILHEGDHHRTRLTHTLEVAQVARSIARSLRLNEDLAEAIALAHDLGHPPFGHAGEDALDEVMAAHGGFDHNAQSLRIVTALENRYAGFDGLDLTWETLEGIVKHNGPVARPLPFALAAYPHVEDLRLDTFASLEAQAAAVADDVAYNAHDVDDGLRSGAFGVDDLRAVPFAAAIVAEVEAAHGGLDERRMRHEIVRRLITFQIEDVIAGGYETLRDGSVGSVEAVRAALRPLLAFSPAMTEAVDGLRALLLERLYRHPAVLSVRDVAKGKLVAIFHRLLDRPELMPESWRRPPDREEIGPARRICDYVAGMTDGYAFQEHARLFGIEDGAPDDTKAEHR